MTKRDVPFILLSGNVLSGHFSSEFILMCSRENNKYPPLDWGSSKWRFRITHYPIFFYKNGRDEQKSNCLFVLDDSFCAKWHISHHIGFKGQGLNAHCGSEQPDLFRLQLKKTESPKFGCFCCYLQLNSLWSAKHFISSLYICGW